MPPQTGDYVFFIASDNQGKLYLSSDEDPANRHLIAEETAQSDPRRWATTVLSDLPSKRSDQYPSTEWPEGNTIHLETVSLANNNISIQWSNGGALQSTSSLAPPVTWNNEAGSGSFSTAAVGPAKFYRVIR